MTHLQTIPHCRVCGQSIDSPSNAEAFGAFGRVWFVTHTGQCASRTRTAIGALGTTAMAGVGAVLAKKYPAAAGVFRAVTGAMRQESHNG